MTCSPETKTRCFVNVPCERLFANLQFILENRIQPEIGLEGDCLYKYSTSEFAGIAATLKGAGLKCTLHAPFFDLAPGALDKHILAASRAKLHRAFALIEIFQPASIVCHLNFEENKHGYKEAAWFANSLATWQELLAVATGQGVPMVLENTYETAANQHEKMLTALDSPYARFCLDVGHVNAFARNSWRDWLPQLSPWLGQVHLHDNNGERDQHLAPGQGSFDFAGFFDFLKQENLSPLITLEPHTETGVRESLTALEEMCFFNAQ